MFGLLTRIASWIGANALGLGAGWAFSDIFNNWFAPSSSSGGNTPTSGAPGWYDKLKQKLGGFIPALFVPVVILLIAGYLAYRLGLFKRKK